MDEKRTCLNQLRLSTIDSLSFWLMPDISRGTSANILCFVWTDFGLLLAGFSKYLTLSAEGNKGMSLHGGLWVSTPTELRLSEILFPTFLRLQK